jgi:hypothetical protein
MNGTKVGRPRKVDDAEHIGTAQRMRAGGHTAKDIAKYLGVGRAFPHLVGGGRGCHDGLPYSGVRKPGRDAAGMAVWHRGNPMARDLEQLPI